MAAAAAAQAQRLLLTVGNPNVGKTTLINALSGSRFEVGNWPGTTVDRLSAHCLLQGRSLELVDLPGSYSLAATTPEERIARDELLRLRPDVVVNVVDAGNLERNLYLTLELSEMGHPVVVALNLVDEARTKGLSVDAEALSRELAMPVVSLVASRGEGVDSLGEQAMSAAGAPRSLVTYPDAIERASEELQRLMPERSERRWLSLAALAGESVSLPGPVKERAEALRAELGVDPFLEIAGQRYRTAHDMAQRVLERQHVPPALTEKIDRFLLHPWLGLPLFLAGMLLVFRFTFLFSDPWITFVGDVQTVFAGWIAGSSLPAIVQSFLSDGIIGGVGTVMAFAPVLFFLYLAMSFAEASGFLSRAAFIADRVMHWAGLPGRGFIPLMLGFGCNVPAIYATRTMEDFRDRLRVSLAIPFTACSARLAVFVLFASVFFPGHSTLVVFGLYLLGLAIGLTTAAVLGKFAPAGLSSGAMELPAYRLPTLRLTLRQAWLRTFSFIKGAGGAIMVTVLVVWLLLNVGGPRPEDSLYGQLSQLMVPIFAPMGVTDWRLVGALIPGFIAKEVVIGTLGVSYLGADPVAPLTFLAGLHQLGASFLHACWAFLNAVPQMFGLPQFSPPEPEAPGGLAGALAPVLHPAGALAYLVFLLLYTPCVATVVALKQEFGTRWAAFSVVYQLLVAYVLGLLAYLVLK